MILRGDYGGDYNCSQYRGHCVVDTLPTEHIKCICVAGGAGECVSAMLYGAVDVSM